MISLKLNLPLYYLEWAVVVDSEYLLRVVVKFLGPNAFYKQESQGKQLVFLSLYHHFSAKVRNFKHRSQQTWTL